MPCDYHQTPGGPGALRGADVPHNVVHNVVHNTEAGPSVVYFGKHVPKIEHTRHVTF